MTSERQSPSGGQKLSIERTDHIALVATNVETSVAWHVDMLGFENFGTAAGSIRAVWLPANRRWPEGSPMSISCSIEDVPHVYNLCFKVGVRRRESRLRPGSFQSVLAQ